ncbi:D-aminopeptidase [Bombella mellum]|uniref:Aminopeptidase n=1 Tax=Bombella mellum TaxID=2039288 RepID=A0ABR5ZTX1_9PROT|nr:D-aminopeptidase [Bombella mellum]MBA5727688.1 aminopeptidase [Bombella mellum]
MHAQRSSLSRNERLDAEMHAIAARHPGPGGAAVVLHEGEVIARHCWGYASLERRLPFTSSSLFRICSITKQFTCATLLDRYEDPEILAPYIRRRLPRLRSDPPTVMQLAHNQSGLRDYWAVAMLHGAAIEGTFSPADSDRVIAGTRSLQFLPGTSYSYVNQNFRLISEAMEEESGLSFAELLQQHVFDRVGMRRAILAAETSALPDGTTGYEGTQEGGYWPARNHIHWTGDAGMGASLDDMIAWETFIDRQRDDPKGLYNRMSRPVQFDNGHKAPYGFGLQHGTVAGHEITAHGGALRGWRSHRLHCAALRLSVVVLFNHMSPAQQAAASLFRAFLGEDGKPAARTPPSGSPQEPHALEGLWLDEETGLSARITAAEPGQLQLRYLMLPEPLDIISPQLAEAGSVRLRHIQDGQMQTGTQGASGPHIIMGRPGENRHVRLRPYPDTPQPDPSELAGEYECEELDGSRFTITFRGGLLHGGFSGILGTGRMERLTALGPDLWTFPCPRALDHTPPGDWTLHFQRRNGRIHQLRASCWLARNLVYQRL